MKPDSNSMTIFIVLNHNDFMGDLRPSWATCQQRETWIHKSGSEDRTYAVLMVIETMQIGWYTLGNPKTTRLPCANWQYDHDADTGKHKSYVNGVHIDSASEAVTIDLYPRPLVETAWMKITSGTGRHIAEIRIYDRALEDAERQAVENELRDKWFSELPPKPISAIHFTAVTGLREGTGSVAAGATVGTLSATDGIGNITYSLVPGEDDDDSDSFTIEGNEVKVASAALTAGTYNFRVKGEDEAHEVVASFTVTVFEKTEFLADGLVLHLDAADYNEATGEWVDKTAINSVSQAMESSRPTKIDDGLNGLPVVRFDGTDQHLNLDWGDDLEGSLGTDGITIFLVMRDGGERSRQVIMGNYGSANQLAISKSSQGQYPIIARIYGSSQSSFDSCEFTNETGPYVLTLIMTIKL